MDRIDDPSVDLGGVNVGSWCVDAEDHFAEGMTYPPIKIVEHGVIRKDIEDVYLRRSRAPALVGLDLRAHIASNNVAKQRMLELIDRYGAKTINVVMKKQMDTPSSSSANGSGVYRTGRGAVKPIRKSARPEIGASTRPR